MIMREAHWPTWCFSWAETAAEGAGTLLECSLGSYSSRLLLEWSLPEGFDAGDAALRLPDKPMFGLMVVLFWIRYLVTLPLVLGFMPISLARLGVITSGGTLMIGRMMDSCRGPLQTVQRAELWGSRSCFAGF